MLCLDSQNSYCGIGNFLYLGIMNAKTESLGGQNQDVIYDLTGESIVYPGHPLVLATAIMQVFQSYMEANKSTEQGYSAALRDSRIPGSGCHVQAAMSTLSLGARGGDIDTMIVYAKQYWEEGRAGGHDRYVDAGIAQAKKIEPYFRAFAAEWFKTAAVTA